MAVLVFWQPNWNFKSVLIIDSSQFSPFLVRIMWTRQPKCQLWPKLLLKACYTTIRIIRYRLEVNFQFFIYVKPREFWRPRWKGHNLLYLRQCALQLLDSHSLSSFEGHLKGCLDHQLSNSNWASACNYIQTCSLSLVKLSL